MPSFIPRSIDDITNGLVARVLARSAATVITKLDELYTLMAAIAPDIAAAENQLANLRNARNLLNPDITEDDYDSGIQEYPDPRLKRQQETSASGAVLLVVRADSSTLQIMPKGTTVGRVDDSTAVYRTGSAITFNIGVLSISDIPITCALQGPDGNCAAGAIGRGVSVPSWVVSVANLQPLNNGYAVESVLAAQKRLRAYLSSMGGSQKAAMEFLALSFVGSDGVRSALAKSFADPLNPRFVDLLVDIGDTGTTTSAPTQDIAAMTGLVPKGGQAVIAHPGPATKSLGYITVLRASTGLTETLTEDAGQIASVFEEGWVYVPSGKSWSLLEGDVWTLPKYAIWLGYLSELQLAVSGDVNDPVSNPGWQANGCRVIAHPAPVQPWASDVHVVPVNGADPVVVNNRVLDILVGFAQTLGPGEPLYLSQAGAAVLADPDVTDVKFYVPGSAPQQPAQDVYPQERYVVRVASNALTFITGV